MTTSFSELCSKLHIDPNQGNEAALKTLADWCFSHVSRDVSFEGSLSEKYGHYVKLASAYLDEFVTHIPEHNTDELQFNGMSVIQYAAYQGYDHYIKASDLPPSFYNTGTAAGMTALHLAAVRGYVNTVEVLLDKGANPLLENNNAQLPIYSALMVPMLHEQDLIHKKERVFNCLKKQAPQSIMHQDKSGDTVFQLMATYGFYHLMQETLKEGTQLAFSHNNLLHYPIHNAILNQQMDICRLLLEIPQVGTLADGENRVALHYAARYGNKELIELCCQVTADINIRDRYNKTPLILAGEADNIDAVAILLEKGADQTLTDYEGHSIAYYAEESGDERLKALLEES